MRSSRQSASQGRRAVLLYAAGVYLLAIVFLAPHPGYAEGRSFFSIALESPWDRLWDWPAAWCSIKIMLLSLGVAALMAALGNVLNLTRRGTLGHAALLLSVGTAMGFCWGAYCLVKALF